MNPLELPLPVVVDNLLPLLSNADLASLRSVSRHAKALVEDEVLWKRKVLADFTFPPHATARMGGWHNLYRGLSNPHVYVWGQLSQGRLGIDAHRLDAAVVDDANSIDGGIPYPVRLTAIGGTSASSSHDSRPRRLDGRDDDGEAGVGAVVEIVAGGWAFHARTSTGKVWHWGTMDGETFAGPNASPRDPGVEVDTPQLMHGLPRIESLSGGRCHAVALTHDHELLEWRAWGTVWKLQGLPIGITNPPASSTHSQVDGTGALARSNIKQLEAGWSFSAVLTQTGEVWIWYSDWNADRFERTYYTGPARERMLHANPPGYGDQKLLPLDVDPLQLPGLAASGGERDEQPRIVQIAAGEDFLIALTEAGTLHRMDLHLPASTGDEWATMRQAHDLVGGREDIDLSAVVHRLRMRRLLGSATWEALTAFEQPQSHPAFDPAWLHAPTGVGEVGKIAHISAHFRRFVAILPLIHASAQAEDEAAQNQTLVLLGTPAGSEPEMVPELQARGVIKVTMGDYHFGALTQQGDILTWGAFSKGALGNWPPPWSRPPPRAQTTNITEHGGEGDEGERGWFSNLVPLPRVFRGGARPRLGLAARAPRGPQTDAPSPAAIQIHPQNAEHTPFAFDIAFAGWHSSALVMPSPS